ncbi:ferrous iron transport protein A [Dehalococcoidia bacterium]|nr:ferrous iron transport protein A [Dehalococcoidia bacterium]MCL0097565.1 ferrous iron transport protein A [Dehalococcoidia bacterium]
MAAKQLSELRKGDKGRIVKIRGKGSLHRRLLDVGVISGSEIEMQRVAAPGDPIEIKTKGGNLSLRREEAAGIQVEIA